jgi:hypothetical protein
MTQSIIADPSISLPYWVEKMGLCGDEAAWILVTNYIRV